MKIESFQNLARVLRNLFTAVKALKTNEARKEDARRGALDWLLRSLGEDKSVLIVTRKGLALCDVNPQAHAEFDRASTSAEISAIIEAEKGIKAAHVKLAAAISAAKNAGLVTVANKNAVRIEILSADKSKAMMANCGAAIRSLRDNSAKNSTVMRQGVACLSGK